MLRDRVVQEAEARQLPALIAEWLDRSDAYHWIACALQLDLPLLIERPELVLPCLYRRCFWFGDTAFYPGRGEVPAEAAEVAAIVTEWIEEQPMRWLRALRPPLHPLDAGVVEEYRTAKEGAIAFSADGSVIGLITKTAEVVGWDRQTGRRIDARGVIAEPTPAWTHEWAKSQISIRSKDRTWTIAVPEHETVSGSWDLGDDLVLVKSWYEPDPYDDITSYRLYLVDATTGRVRWTVDDDCQSAIRVGDTLHTFGNGIARRSLATGDELSRQAFTWASAVVFSPDGTLIATRAFDAVIRVWELAQLAPKIVSCRVRGGELSEDGKRLLAHTSLCDAQTGDWIAEIPFSGQGNWLEGGPPTGAWSHANGVVLQVLWGVTVWDSADGHQIAHYDFDTNARDAVAIDPLGRYFAFFQHPERLAVYELRTGVVVFETRAELQRLAFRRLAFGWTPDGAMLWWQTVHQFVRGVSANNDWQPFELSEVPKPPPEPATVQDGLLVVGALAAPMDSTDVTSHGGTIFVGADHYRLE